MSEIPILVDEPPAGKPVATIVLAHGAGAAMDSDFMEEVAHALAAESLRVVRFEFPYMQEKRKSGRRGPPDSSAVLQETWLSVIGQIGPQPKLVIGGKSMGGRIASMIADRANVHGLVCMGFPFHPPGRPTNLRVAHLKELQTPTLILQGERDTLGSRDDIAGYTLSPKIRLVFLPDGDHSFKPRKSSGRTYGQNLGDAVAETAAFCRNLQAVPLS